jgi:hypothetical protein
VRAESIDQRLDCRCAFNEAIESVQEFIFSHFIESIGPASCVPRYSERRNLGPGCSVLRVSTKYQVLRPTPPRSCLTLSTRDYVRSATFSL